MDESLQQDLRRRLESERDAERERLDGAEPIEQDKELHNLARGETGNAQAAENIRQRSERLSTIDHTQSRLDKIEHALARMDEGSYGVCEACGDEIDAERLRAYPLATTCIDDARDDEEPTGGG